MSSSSYISLTIVINIGTLKITYKHFWKATKKEGKSEEDQIVEEELHLTLALALSQYEAEHKEQRVSSK